MKIKVQDEDVLNLAKYSAL